MPLRANKNYLYRIGRLLKLAEYIQQNFTYAKGLRKLMYLWRAVEFSLEEDHRNRLCSET